MTEYELDITVYGSAGAIGLVAEVTISLPFAPQCGTVLQLWGPPVGEMGVQVAAYDLKTGHFWGAACNMNTNYRSQEEFRKAFAEAPWVVRNAEPQ